MDRQATGLAAAFLSFDPQGEKNFSEEVFCEDLPEGESLFGEIFPDQEAMKSYYLQSACQLWPEACTGDKETSHLRHLLSRLRKRRLMLYLLCRNWARQHWQLQSECLGLIAENGLSQQQKRNMIRVLNLGLYQACELMGMRDFIREELALCCRQIRELQELLKRMEGKGGKREPETVEAKKAEDFPTGTREHAPASVCDAVSAPEQADDSSEGSEG